MFDRLFGFGIERERNGVKRKSKKKLGKSLVVKNKGVRFGGGFKRKGRSCLKY